MPILYSPFPPLTALPKFEIFANLASVVLNAFAHSDQGAMTVGIWLQIH